MSSRSFILAESEGIFWKNEVFVLLNLCKNIKKVPLIAVQFVTIY